LIRELARFRANVVTWMLQRLAAAGFLKGKTVGIDATTLEGNAVPPKHRAARHLRLVRFLD
jgi:hypothetical protein